MELITLSSACSSSLVFRPCFEPCSSSPMRSPVQLCPQNSRILGRCSYLGFSPSSSSYRSLIELSAATSFRLSSLIVCSSTVPLQTQSDPLSSTRRTEKTSLKKLSAKERRKLRNERREEAKASQVQPWKEMVENRLLEKKKKISGWQEDADINRCISKGFSWWMIQVARRFEFEVADQISIIFSERFPENEFEVLVPTVPVKTKLKDGSMSEARKKMYEGIVLLRCVLDRDVHDMVKKIPQTYDFFGNFAGLSIQPIVMPAPVSNFNMDNMLQQIQKEEEEYEQLKKHCREEAEEQQKEKHFRDEEQKRRDLEQRNMQSKTRVLEEGATIKILSGPFAEFTGVVTELLPKVNKVKVDVTIFGNGTPVVLDMELVTVVAAAFNSKK